MKTDFKISLCVFLIALLSVSFTHGAFSNIYPDRENKKTDQDAMFFVAPVINLSVTPFEDRIALLTWTTSDPLLAGTYFIERQVLPTGIWDQIGQVAYNAALRYNDTIAYPYYTKTNFSYRIRFEATTGESTFSNSTLPLELYDLTNPDNVTNLIVSMNSDGFPELTWTKVPGNDILGYEIGRFDGSGYPPLTTVPADSIHFVDLTAVDACSKSHTYIVITIDRSPGLRSVPDYTPPLQTINLVFPPIDECEKLAILRWNTYNRMPGGLGGYRIFRQIDFATPVLVTVLTDTLAQSYDDSYAFSNGHDYTYFVQAFSDVGSGISNSCRSDRIFTGLSSPDSVLITQLGVVDNSFIKIDCFSTPANSIKRLVLERSDDGGTTFNAIDSLYFSGSFVPQSASFQDRAVDVTSQSYAYRLLARDSCYTSLLYSTVSRSVFLQCTPTPTQNTLDWNHYEVWLKGVEGYKVYRTIDGQPSGGELLGNLSSTTLTYPDLLAGADPTKELCYFVVASENPGNPYLNNAVSVSNTYCVTKGATLFMPNAFHPGGDNNRFRPVSTFVDPQSFEMTVYNRWGQQIFVTNDIVNGWNGLIGNQLAPMGLYAYIVTYQSVGGESYSKRGYVHVVR